MNDFYLVEIAPSIENFMTFRKSVGWQNADFRTTRISIENTLYWISLLKSKKTVGCGRIIGDGGGIYYYIQDVIVLQEYQKLGLGHKIMEKIMAYIQTNAKPGAFIALMAAKGVDDFYARYGFEKRPSEKYGSGIGFFIK